MANITERDANCKNCLHVRVCTFRNPSEDEKICHQFINKADVEEVRHGEWKHSIKAAHWYGKDKCSECHYRTYDGLDLSHFNYCPNCGAKMDGATDTIVGDKMDGKGEGE